MEGGMGRDIVIGRSPQNASKLPFLTNIGLKVLGKSKKTTRDGQPAKRRGPKPDLKPALTRRQELNRQAQRTHRERKEQYIKALETEVSRLREAYADQVLSSNLLSQQNREALQTLKAENDLLKEMLTSRGIPYEVELESRGAAKLAGNPSESLTRSTTASQYAGPQTSNPPVFTSPPSTFSGSNSRVMSGEHVDTSPGNEQSFRCQRYHGGQQPGFTDCPVGLGCEPGTPEVPEPVDTCGIFEEDPQLAIDFLLSLEEPCRSHQEILCRTTYANEGDFVFTGHALMASCPPLSYIASTPPDQMYRHQSYDLPPANLNVLLNLSQQLVTDGQITPIMALQSLKSHELYCCLTREDVKFIIETLIAKIRCYGFGAVVEDFEFRDCLSSVASSKLDSGPPRLGDDAMFT